MTQNLTGQQSRRMLIDTRRQHTPFPPQPHRTNSNSWDVADILHSDLFSANNTTPGMSSAASTISSPSSREATPLPTPEQGNLGESFPSPTARPSFATTMNAVASTSTAPSRARVAIAGADDDLFNFLDTGADDDSYMTLGSNQYKAGFNTFGDDFGSYMSGLEDTYGRGATSNLNPPTSDANNQQMDLAALLTMGGLDMDTMPGMMDISTMGMPYDLQDPNLMSMDPIMDPGAMGINPQLVDSPASVDPEEPEPKRKSRSSNNAEEEEESDEEMLEDPEEDRTVEAPKKRGARRKKLAEEPVVEPTTTTRRSARKSTAASTAASIPSPAASTSSSRNAKPTEAEKITLTIAPHKVGGRGTAGGRRGTVLSGGITKRGAGAAGAAHTPSVAGLAAGLSSSPAIVQDKENATAESKPKRGRKAAAAHSRSASVVSATPAPTAYPTTYPPPTYPTDGQQQTSTYALPTVDSSLTASAVVHSSRPAPGPGMGIPHSSSGLGIVPPPLPNGQRALTGVDLTSLGFASQTARETKGFAFAIPMGTFGGAQGLVAANVGMAGAQATVQSQAPQQMAAMQQAPQQVQIQAQQPPSQQRGMSEFGDDEFDVGPDGANGALPSDWRPSPEVFAKMTSKEKRQLRNKISARNFRVRRKEYISTLEGDIAERDRLLDAIRTELGSSRSENLALRREVENLKRVLLEGRGTSDAAAGASNAGASNGDVHFVEGLDLPPPAPLPERSAAEVLAARASTPAAAVVKPNTNKDLPMSPRLGGTHANGFWGGNGMFGGGVTAVHTTFVPAVAMNVGLGAHVLQENMNPLMSRISSAASSPGSDGSSGDGSVGSDSSSEDAVAKRQASPESFEGFADSNMFTMKNLDAYRMHLWGKMAAQYHHHQARQQQESNNNNNVASPPSPPIPHLAGSPHAPGSPYLSGPAMLPGSPYWPHTPYLPQQSAAPTLFQQQQQAQQQALTGLAARMQRSWFAAPSSTSSSHNGNEKTHNNGNEKMHNTGNEKTPFGNSTNTYGGGGGPNQQQQQQHSPLLAALLSGKTSVLGSSNGGYYSYSSASFKRQPPSSVSSAASSGGDNNSSSSNKHAEKQAEKQKAQVEKQKAQVEQAQAAIVAAVASQTLLRKLGGAFWEAFSGSSSSSSASSSTSNASSTAHTKHFDAPKSSAAQVPQKMGDWDAEKVRKVLDGTAVVRVVDVDQLHRLSDAGCLATATATAASSLSSSSSSGYLNASTSSSGYLNASTSSSGYLNASTSSSGYLNASTSSPYLSASSRNISRGGSVSVPSSPMIRASSSSSSSTSTEKCSLAACLEEGMKSLKL